MSKTAVVILNWNGRCFLEQFLPSVVRFSSGDMEIIVADNGSDDDSLSFLSLHFPQVRQIILDRNYGFAEGYNRALEQVAADYYVLLNSDVEVTEGWLEPLTALMDSDPSIAAVAPKLKSYHDKSKFEYAGASGGFIDMLGYPFCRGRVLQCVETDEGQYDDCREVFWATGACMVVRAELYRRFSGLDADFFAHQEEIDLCWRMKLAGYKVYVEPRSVVYHVGGGTLSSDSPRKVYLNFRNNLSMIYKNLSSKSLCGVLPLRLILDGLSAMVFLLQRKPKQFSAVFRAHMDFYRMLPALRHKRGLIQRSRVCSPSGIYRGSVIFRYFTGRKISPVK